MKKRLLSVLLVLGMMLAFLPVSVQATEPLPGFFGFAGQIQWNHVPGADRYYIRGIHPTGSTALRNEAFTNFDSKTWTDEYVRFDLQHYMDMCGDLEEGHYHLTVLALNGDQELGYENTVEFVYKPSIPKLETPKNLTWDGTTIRWDPVEGTAYYWVGVYQEPYTQPIWQLRPHEPVADLTEQSGYSGDSPVTFKTGVKYYFKVCAYPTQGEARISDTAESEWALGEDLKAGYKGVTQAHTITVTDGKAESSVILKGKPIKIEADSKENYQFSEWEVVSGEAAIQDPKIRNTILTPGDTDITLRATYTYAGSYLNTIYVFVEPPMPGAHPEDATVQASIYRVTDTAWTDTKTGKKLSESDTFEPGKTYEVCVTVGSNGNPIPENFSAYINETAEGVTKERKGMAIASLSTTFQAPDWENPFVDVKESDEYFDAVLWAYNHQPQITNGKDATHFAPKDTVKRGEAVTFLWRVMGEPAPKSMKTPFVDLNQDYYKKAVAWAVEQGIVKGKDATHFCPEDTLTTAHMVTFLYRTLNSGKDGWYEEAATWAKSIGLLDKVGIQVDDKTNCPRGKVVMLLYSMP